MDNEIRLHLGCGKRFLPGFFHIDIEEFEHIDRVGTIDDLSDFDSESCAMIYSSHAFEYFDRIEAAKVLSEWRRVLKIGGEIRIAVPDFAALVRIYQDTGDISDIIGPLFGRWAKGQDQSGSQQKQFVGDVLYHRTVWDKASLTQVLLGADFTDVTEYNPVEFLASFDSNFDDHSLAFYPHFDRSGTQISLCLKGFKS
jgi:ubiquinone/menaquinone biosynthesis C-methylase UbiE